MPLTGCYLCDLIAFSCNTFSAGLGNAGLDRFHPGVVFDTGTCDIDVCIDNVSSKSNSR